MSRFYLVEFRYDGQRRWHPWMRCGSKASARIEARGLVAEALATEQPADAARVLRVDTDAMTVAVEWETP